MKRLLVEFGRELAGRLTRAEFHALAEHLFRGVGVAMLRHTACVLLLAPLIGFVVKSLAQAYATEQLGLPDKRAKLVKIVPDSLFAPVASAAVAVAGWKASAGAGI